MHQVDFSLHDYMETSGQQDVKFNKTSVALQSLEFSSLVRRLLVEFEKYDSLELVQSTKRQ